MKILITGIAGYIGSELINHLLMAGHKITGIDNLLYEKTSLLSYITDPNFTFINHDIIIPLAALVGANLCDKNPVDAELVNFGHIKTICDIKSKDQRIIFPNTNSGYSGLSIDDVITEEYPLKPTSIYGSTKCRAENEIKQGINWTTLRLATVFGSSRRPRFDLLVNNLVLRAMKDKMIVLFENKAMRNYIHIQDICAALIHIINNQDPTLNQTFNVGNDQLNCSKLDLTKQIQKIIPLEIIQAEYTKDPDKRDYKVSSEKFYKTGFVCKHSLEDGIKQLKKTIELIDVPVNGNY